MSREKRMRLRLVLRLKGFEEALRRCLRVRQSLFHRSARVEGEHDRKRGEPWRHRDRLLVDFIFAHAEIAWPEVRHRLALFQHGGENGNLRELRRLDLINLDPRSGGFPCPVTRGGDSLCAWAIAPPKARRTTITVVFLVIGSFGGL